LLRETGSDFGTDRAKRALGFTTRAGSAEHDDKRLAVPQAVAPGQFDDIRRRELALLRRIGANSASPNGV